MKRSRLSVAALSFVAVACLFLPVAAVAQSTGTSSDPLGSKPGVRKATDSITAQEFRDQLEWWAHDDRAGREPGTKGSIEAGDVSAEAFKELGLLPHGDVVDGERTYFQYFDKVGNGRIAGKMGYDPQTTVLKVGDQTFQFGEDYTITGGVGYRREGAFDLKDLEVVFAGYGINARRLKYNDYTDVDVKGKAVLVFNHEPQEKDAKSRWNGTKPRREANLRTKANLASRNGAKLMIVVDGPLHHDPAKDPLRLNETFSSRRCPVLHVRKHVAEALLAGSGKSLGDLQKTIDANDKPASQGLQTRVSLKASRKIVARARNVLAMFPGSDPKLKHEAVIIGAHYDHLGLGFYGSRARGRAGEVHNGADDNATGAVGVLELAEAFATSGVKTRRSIIFLLFDAEEQGLLGAYHYVAKPTVPLDKIAAMINMDMIGHVRNNKMSVSGTGTCKEWDKICKAAAKGSALKWSWRSGAFGGSDHLPFVGKKIPVLMFNSGLHSYYHTPEDDSVRCNAEGAAEVLKGLFRMAYQCANLKKKPEWTGASRGSRRTRGLQTGMDVETVRKPKRGAKVTRIRQGSPAAQAGLKKGDVITRINRRPIRSSLSISRALRGVRPGREVKIEYLRDGKKMKTKFTFPKPKPKPKKTTKKKKKEVE